MKRLIILTVLISILDICGFSQNVRFGINAGATASFMKSRYQGVTEETDGTQKFGMTAGVMADVKIARNFHFTPSLNFTQKGAVYRYMNADISRGERTLNYTELLLNVLYCLPAEKGKFSIGIGPGISYGMSGKYKDKMNLGGQIRKGDIKFGNGQTDEYKPLDFGGNIMTVYEFSSGVTLALNYYLGLNNLAVYDFGGNMAKNRYLAVRVGYFFSNLKK